MQSDRPVPRTHSLLRRPSRRDCDCSPELDCRHIRTAFRSISRSTPSSTVQFKKSLRAPSQLSIFSLNLAPNHRLPFSQVPPLLSARDYDSIVDPQLADDCTELSLSGLCDLAQDCISDQEMVRPTLPEIQRRLARCVSLQNKGDRPESYFRPSPRVSSARDKGWEEEDEYEVRDLPDGVPIGQGLGRAAWDAVGPSSGVTSEAGSSRV